MLSMVAFHNNLLYAGGGRGAEGADLLVFSLLLLLLVFSNYFIAVIDSCSPWSQDGLQLFWS